MGTMRVGAGASLRCAAHPARGCTYSAAQEKAAGPGALQELSCVTHGTFPCTVWPLSWCSERLGRVRSL